MNFIITILILIVMLSLIICIHEFGHFITAKKSGVYVDEFSMGMGPALLKYKPKKSETTYCLRLFPIGGFVSMAEKVDPDNKTIKKERVLENKSFLRQFMVLIAGIFMNCVLAIVLFFISGLAYGMPVEEPIVKSVVEGKPAQVAGIEAGDRILKVNGVSIKSWDDFLLEASGKKIKDNYVLTVSKTDGRVVDYNLVPEIVVVKKQEVTRFGIEAVGTVYHKGFVNALKYSVVGFYDTSKTILKILGSLFTGQVSLKSLSGPVGIYSIVDDVKHYGLETIIYLTAYLSINVAIMNLLPVPVFDGGRILLLIIEKVTKHKSSEKVELIINYIGFGLMILLMLYVTFNDIVKLVVK